MRGTSSAPTARVLEIIELLARAGDARLRFVDISRELGINSATAHSILKTLCDKGWATRDPVDKAFAAGPALAAIAACTESTRSVAHAARTVATELGRETGYAVSVIERVGDSLVITAFEGGEVPEPPGIPGDRIPFAAPFGVAFAAWEPPEEQQAWVQRAATTERAVVDRLNHVLARTRQRGFDIDWMTPALARAVQMIETVSSSGVPDRMRTTLEQLRGEFITIGFLAEDHPERHTQPIATISAPVTDQYGRATLIICIHPLRALPAAEVDALGVRLTSRTTALSRDAGDRDRSGRR